MNQNITVRIPDNMRKDLEEMSEYENKPVSDIVRDSIRKYIAVHRFRKLRNKILPFAEARGILTDDDIFDNMS